MDGFAFPAEDLKKVASILRYPRFLWPLVLGSCLCAIGTSVWDHYFASLSVCLCLEGLLQEEGYLHGVRADDKTPRLPIHNGIITLPTVLGSAGCLKVAAKGEP